MMRFEWKKIFERRLNVVAMILGYVLLGVCAFSYVSLSKYYDEETESNIEGIVAIRMERERDEGLTDAVTEEYMTRLIGEIQKSGIDLENDEEAYTKIRRSLGDIFYFASKNYTDMRDQRTDMNALGKVDLTEGARFYEQRMKKITDYLDLDFSFGNYKEAEKEFWIRKAGNTAVPFRWGSKVVMYIIQELIGVGFWLWFVVVICVSSIFSSEYESDAASLLLTTRHGKDRLIGAKIATAVLFAVVYPSLGIGMVVGGIGLLLGFPGAELPVQLWDSVIPYNMTAGQMCLGSFAMILLMSVVITLVLLGCSAGLRSSLATLVIGAAVMIAPAFFPMSKKSGLWNHINYLFPVRAMNLKDVLGAFVSYTVGNHVISYLGMILIVYTAVGVMALLSIKKGFLRAR